MSDSPLLPDGRRPVPRTALITALALLLLCLGPAGRAAAVDGRTEVRGSRQSGGAGETSYRTDTLVENYSLGQRIELSRSWLLNVDMLSRREQLESHGLGQRTYTRTTALIPAFTLNFRRDNWQGALAGRGMRRDWFGSGVEARRDESADVSAWARAEFEVWELDLRVQHQASRRLDLGVERENREANRTVNLRRYLAGRNELRYTYNWSERDLLSFGNEVQYRSHQVQYRGMHEFDGGRGRVDVDATVAHFRQDDTQSVGGGRRLLVPVWAGFSLDDTPEFQDPLEPDPVRDGRLADGDRDAPSGVNIGDAAPAVQQWGGDWRNIIFDFGETEEIVSAVLYVDTRVGFPGLIDWQVYVSDDPEGRDWGTPLDPATYSLAYEDLANGRQGWLLTFSTPVLHRRLKMVDIKAGLTEPDIRVTEWEVFGPATTSRETVSRTLRGRLRGEVRYDLTSAVEIRYANELDQRRFLDLDERLTGQMHLVGLTWRLADWRLNAHHQIDLLDSPTGRNTDASSQVVSLANSADPDLTWRFTYTRADDRSYTARHRTDTWGADANWRALPQLVVNQKITYGLRDAEDVDGTANSWAFITTLRGDIRPNMNATLRRADRFTDVEAGSGFTNFNDTDWMLNWSILPQVTLGSQVSYKVRDDEQWILRNTLSWAPLPGGSIALRFYGSDYQDTRTDYVRRGVGAAATWRPRQRLRLEAGVEQTLIKEDADRNTPLNLNARGSWTF